MASLKPPQIAVSRTAAMNGINGAADVGYRRFRTKAAPVVAAAAGDVEAGLQRDDVEHAVA